MQRPTMAIPNSYMKLASYSEAELNEDTLGSGSESEASSLPEVELDLELELELELELCAVFELWAIEGTYSGSGAADPSPSQSAQNHGPSGTCSKGGLQHFWWQPWV